MPLSDRFRSYSANKWASVFVAQKPHLLAASVATLSTVLPHSWPQKKNKTQLAEYYNAKVGQEVQQGSVTGAT